MNEPVKRCDINDFSKLDLSEPGIINYKMYAQDGSFIPMTIADNLHNRRFVSWVQVYDRYTKRED